MTTVATQPGLDDIVAEAQVAVARATRTTRAASARVVADTLAVTFAGARGAEHRRLVARLSEPADVSQRANVVADSPRRAPEHLAALLNGTAAASLELDETLVGGGHPAAHVVPAALAVAQKRGSHGSELVDAVLLGYEVSGQLYRTRRFSFPSHPHGAIGAIGAAAAAAKLRGTDPVAAAACAATLPLLPTWAACFEGATARNAWTGLGALIGVLASDLAAAGMTGAHAEPLQGLCRVSEALVPTGQPGLTIVDSAIRLHPIAAPLQSAVEAASVLRRQLGGCPAGVVVDTVGANLKFVRLPAAGELSARFSLPYAVAWGLVDGSRGFSVSRESIAVARTVEVDISPELEAAWPRATGARVRAGNDSFTCAVPLGHPDRPLPEAQLHERWRALLGPRERLLEALVSLPASDADALVMEFV